MRVLAVGPRVYLGDIYLALLREGHEVRVHAEDPPEERAFGGLIQPVPDWRAELDWVGRDDLLLFERANRGEVQDALRAEGYRVIGGSAFGDRLENDRAFGQAVLREIGLPIAESRGFDDPQAALDWLAGHPGRHVLKFDDSHLPTFVGEHPGGADLAFMLRRAMRLGATGGVLLQERLDGVEVGVGAYFDGRRFLRPACIDFEHKRFFPGEMGEMTGEMGTLASYEGAGRLFEATLGRVAPLLARAGHVGYVNLNLMVDERGPLPLEFTCRFGNPGFAVLAAMQRDGWGDLFRRMAEGGSAGFAATPGWSVAIVLTVPPFPAVDAAATAGDDVPLFFLEEPRGEELRHYHLVDARRDAEGQLLVRRRSGHAMIVTGTGPSVAAAQEAARARARNVVAPELRWREDIGERFLQGEGARLASLGWLD
ncbi:phosphoribosylamine--glycine ligase [Roseicella aquatilis]|uniref:phosphoribosylamine--glycine ligase n=1 Tax=Roseicella aquatilis TaxID=2527868 RepID=A0A4V2WLV5_9PROT|nr:phosphoribosylamine--glycine ligase [Roseicella aquatilis]TCZ64865.1 phosphoribosylamine--glycine ligase [Roseicella aquatilis]